ncbi:MAG: zinc ABC transporter substrate-binding protein, partial [Microbacterium sp.]
AEEDHDHAEGDDHDHAGHDHVEGFNEHVWYDPHTIVHVAEGIAAELSEIAPDDAATFEANLAEFASGIEDLEAALATIDAESGGAEIFVTEPVPLYLTTAAGLVNVAPEAFTEAVEEGRDVPASTLLEATKLLQTGDVRAVIVNAQTGGAETTAVLDEAETLGLPVVEFTETLPEGQTYLSWMQSNIEALEAALQA